MSPQTLELARRMRECRAWQWIPGMQVVVGDIGGFRYLGENGDGRKALSVPIDWTDAQAEAFDLACGTLGPWIPDLDDDVTRLAVLLLIRRAYGDSDAYVRLRGSSYKSLPWTWRAHHLRKDNLTASRSTVESGCARTEVDALLAALKAAP
jgi:hypothetical protein